MPHLQPSADTYDFDVSLALLFHSCTFKTDVHAWSAFKEAVFWQDSGRTTLWYCCGCPCSGVPSSTWLCFLHCHNSEGRQPSRWSAPRQELAERKNPQISTAIQMCSRAITLTFEQSSRDCVSTTLVNRKFQDWEQSGRQRSIFIPLSHLPSHLVFLWRALWSHSADHRHVFYMRSLSDGKT